MMPRIQGSNKLGDPADRNRIWERRRERRTRKSTGGFGVPWPSNPQGSVRERERVREGSAAGDDQGWGVGVGRHWQGEPLHPCQVRLSLSPPCSPASSLSIQPSSSSKQGVLMSCLVHLPISPTTHASILRSPSPSACLILFPYSTCKLSRILCPVSSILSLAIILPPPSARQQASNIALSRPRRSRPHVQQTAEYPVCQPTHFCHSQPET